MRSKHRREIGTRSRLTRDRHGIGTRSARDLHEIGTGLARDWHAIGTRPCVGAAWLAWPCQVELRRRQPRARQLGACLLGGGDTAAAHRAVLARLHV